MDGLLQGAFQVHSPFLDHFPDVLDPVLLVFYTGGLDKVLELIRIQKGPVLEPALTTLTQVSTFLEMPI